MFTLMILFAHEHSVNVWSMYVPIYKCRNISKHIGYFLLSKLSPHFWFESKIYYFRNILFFICFQWLQSQFEENTDQMSNIESSQYVVRGQATTIVKHDFFKRKSWYVLLFLITFFVDGHYNSTASDYITYLLQGRHQDFNPTKAKIQKFNRSKKFLLMNVAYKAYVSVYFTDALKKKAFTFWIF